MCIYLKSQWQLAAQLAVSPRPVDLRYDAAADELYILCQEDFAGGAPGVMSVWTRDGQLKRQWAIMPLGVSSALDGSTVYVLRAYQGGEQTNLLRAWQSDGSGGRDLGIPFGYADGQLSGSQDADMDIDAAGNLYVFSGRPYGNAAPYGKTYRVQVFAPNGALLRAWGTPGSGNGQFADSTNMGEDYNDTLPGLGIRCGADGLVYCTDKFNHRIQVFQPDGTFVRAFGSYGAGRGQLNYPMKVAYENGLIWVADAGGAVDGQPGAYLERVQAFTPGGQFLYSYPVTFFWRTDGGWRKFCFTSPTDLWVPSFDDWGTVNHYRLAIAQLAAPVDRLFGFQHILSACRGVLEHAVAALSGAPEPPVSLGAGDRPDLLIRPDGALAAVFTAEDGTVARRVSRDMGANWGVC